MLYFTNLPISFWGYSLDITTYLLNKIPTKSYLALHLRYQRIRNRVKHLKIWSCLTYVKHIIQTNLLQDLRSVGLRVAKKKV